MTGYSNWRDIRAEFVESAGGEEVVEAGKQELLAEVRGQIHDHRRSQFGPLGV